MKEYIIFPETMNIYNYISNFLFRSYLTGVRVSSEGRIMVTVVSVSRVWSISGRRMVIGGEVLAWMRWRRPPMLPSGEVILKS